MEGIQTCTGYSLSEALTHQLTLKDPGFWEVWEVYLIIFFQVLKDLSKYHMSHRYWANPFLYSGTWTRTREPGPTV